MPPQKQANAEACLLSRYDRMVSEGRVRDDPAQREVLAALQSLLPVERPSRRWGKSSPPSPRGLYIWGNVGRGKSMLMDVFFEQAPAALKKRVHFHAFMQDVHARLHGLRKDARHEDDPVAALARRLAEESALLCFDELQATDVADATLLYRLFNGLFSAGVTIVSTSNHPPASLYTGGVQAERFAKFIALIEKHMRVMALSSDADYRTMREKSRERRYFHPLGSDADAFLEKTLERLQGEEVEDALSVQGRVTRFTRYGATTGRFSFGQLCESALGAADYLAIARRLDTVILTDIPQLPPEKRNAARRFVTLIDALYEHKVKLICTAAVAPERIYAEGDGGFEFKRTLSRLIEMQSNEYWKERS